MQSTLEVECLAERLAADPLAPVVLPPDIFALHLAVLDYEPVRLAALDAYLAVETEDTRQAWVMAREHSSRLKERVAAQFNAWMRTQDPLSRCPACGYFSALGALCAECSDLAAPGE